MSGEERQRFEYCVSGNHKSAIGPAAAGSYSGPLSKGNIDATYVAETDAQMRRLAAEDEIEIEDFSCKPTDKPLDSRLVPVEVFD